MNKNEYEKTYHEAAQQYSRGQITFEQLKEAIRALEGHEHEYVRVATGERLCWCGAAE
jgi:hypothetical protein